MSTVNPTVPTPDLQLLQRIKTPIRATAFYGAIGLPALYLPLIISGIESATGLLVFLGLFVLHVAALIGGRTYRAIE